MTNKGLRAVAEAGAWKINGFDDRAFEMAEMLAAAMPPPPGVRLEWMSCRDFERRREAEGLGAEAYGAEQVLVRVPWICGAASEYEEE